MEEIWGQRPTLGRALERVLQSFTYWNVITRNDKTGRIIKKFQFASSTKEIELLFLEMVLMTEPSHSLTFDQLNNLPSAFPFRISITYSDLTKSKRFSLSQINGTREIIILKTT